MKQKKTKATKAKLQAPTPKLATQEVKVGKAKGRPMLQWVGKRPLDRLTAFPAQRVEIYNPTSQKDGWQNLLFHGDNKEVLAWLLANGYRGKINLIYIDPPFDSGADYVRQVSLRGPKGTSKFRTPDMLQDGLQNDGFGELGCEPKPVRFFRIRNWKSHDSASSESAQVFIAYILHSCAGLVFPSSGCEPKPVRFFPLIPFADPHTLNPYAAILYKKMAGAGPSQRTVSLKFFPCHRSEKTTRKSNHCHTSQKPLL